MDSQIGTLHVPSLLTTSSPKLKTFSGDGIGRFEVDDWIKEYEAAGEGAADEIKLRKLPTFLKGAAKDWYEVFIADQLTELKYSDVLTKMKAFFNAENDKLGLHHLLMTTKQGSDQLVADYITSKLKLCKRKDDKMEESEKILHVISGLKPNLQQAMFANNPETIEQLLTLARQHERGFKAAGSQERQSHSKDSHPDLREMKDEFKEMMKTFKQVSLRREPTVPFRREPFPRSDWYRQGKQDSRPSMDQRSDKPYRMTEEMSSYNQSGRSQSQRPRDRQRYWNPKYNDHQDPPTEQWHSNTVPSPNKAKAREASQQPIFQERTSVQRSGGFPPRTNTGRIRCRICGGGHSSHGCPENESANMNQLTPKDQKAIIEGFGSLMILSDDGSSITKHTGSMIKIPAKVNGQRFIAIIDTGSTATCISRNVAQTCGSTMYPFNGPQMASVNGEDVHPSGMMAVDIAVFDGDRELVLRTNVLVLDKLNCDLLLGNNFNKKANLIVDCDSGSISFKQKNNKKGIRVCHLTTMSSDYLDALKIIEAQRAQDEDDLPSHPRNIFMMTGDIPDMPLLGPNLEDLLGPWIPLSREDSDLGLGQSPPQTPEPSDAVASVEMDGEHLKSSSTGTSKEPKKMVHFPLKAKSNSLLPPFANDIITVELCGMQPREKTRYRLCANSWNLQVDDEFITFIGSEGFVIFKNLTSDTYPISQGDKVAFLELEDPVQEKVEGRDYWTLYPKHHYRIRKQAELKLPAVISCPHTLDNIEYFRLLSCEPRINIKQQYIKVRNQQIELLDINNVCTRDFVLLSTFALARAERVSSAEVEALLDESWQDPAQFLEMHLNTASPEVKPTNSKKKRVTRANTKMPTKLTAMTDIILFPGISVSLDVKANYAVKGTGILEIPQQDIAGILEVPMQQVTFNKKFGNVEIKNACKDIVYIIKDKFYINMDQGVNLKMLAAVQPESEPKNLPAEPSTSSEKSEINMFGTRDSGNELEFTKIQSKLPMIGKIPFIVAQDDTKNGNSQAREEKEHMELFEGKRRSGFSPLLAMNNVILPPFGSEVIRVKVGGILPTMYKENSIIARNPRLQPRSNVITFIYNKADVVFHNFSKEQIRIYPNAVVAFTLIDDLVLEQVEGRDYWELIVDIPTKLPKRSKIQLPVKLSSSDSLNTVEMMRIFESREEVNIPEDHLQIRNRQIDFINVENTTNKTIKWRPGTVVARVSRCDCPSSVNREAQDFDLAPPAYEAVSDKFTIAMFNTVRGGLRPGTPRPAAFDFVSSTSQRKHLFTVNSAMIPAQTETRLDVEAIGFLPDNRYRYRTMKMDDVLDVRTKYVSFLDRKTSVVVHNSSDKDKVISPGYLISAVELEYSSIVISLYKPVRAMDNIVIRPDESATLKIEIAENPPIRKTNYYQLRPVSEQFNFQKTMIPIEENEDHYLRIKNTARENLRLLKGEVVAEARRLSPQEVKAFPLAIFTMADEIPTKDGKPSKVSQRSESQSTDVDHSHLEDIGFIQIFRARIVRPTSDRDRLKTVGKEEPVDRIYQKRKQIGMFGPRRQKTTPREQLRELNPHELLEFLKESHPDYDHQNTHNYTEIVFEHDTQQDVHEKERPAGIFQKDANQGIPANEIKQRDANTTNRVVKHVVKINSAWSIYSGLLIVLLIFLMFLRLTEAMNFDEHLTRIHKQQTVKEDSKQFWIKMLMCIGFSAIALALCLKVYRVLKVATNFSDEPSLRASGDIPSPALTVDGIRKQQQYLMNLTEAEKQKSGFLPIVDTFNSSTLGSGSVQISKQLERDEQKRIEHLLDSYFDVFAFDDTEIGYCSVLNHEIDTGDHAPVFIKPRRYAPIEKDEIRKQIQEMLDSGCISPSKSPWASPPLLVSKKDGKQRFCIDYRKLNSVTTKDKFPTPYTEDALDCTRGSQYFTTLDLKSGYWQVPLRKEDRKKTAFWTPDGGLYHFNVMPFGLCGAPATFCRLMKAVLHGIPDTEVFCYLDDVLCHSKTFSDHIRILESVLSRLRKAGLTLNPPKCFFGARAIGFLGHVISADGVSPDNSKILAVQQFAVPKSKTEVRSFLGLASYYRKFVEGFATIAGPLHKITGENHDFKWGDAEESAFHELKRRLMMAPVLRVFNPKLPTEVRADASMSGLGALLVQKDADGWHVCAYASRQLSDAETRYPPTEMETLGIIFALQKFRVYLLGVRFTVVTDHHSLCHLMKKERLASRLARWVIQLAEYDFEIKYKSGSVHKDADCLSRYPVEPAPTEEQIMVQVLSTVAPTKEDLLSRQDDDDFVKNLKHIIDNYEDTPPRDRSSVDNFTLVDRILYKKRKISNGEVKLVPVIPKSMQENLLYFYHDDPTAGHLGFHKTLDRIRDRFYFPKLAKVVRRYVQTCQDCQTKKYPAVAPAGLLNPISVSEPFERLGIDILGPFPRSSRGNRYIIVSTEYATRYAFAKAIPDATALAVAEFIVDDIIAKFGPPREILRPGSTVHSQSL